MLGYKIIIAGIYMTCKDCPHFDVCKMYGALPTKRRIDSKWKNCPFRNDKAKYIELPDPPRMEEK